MRTLSLHARSRGWAAIALLLTLLWTGPAGGDADLPVRVSEIPKVLFIVERSSSMDTEWDVVGSRSRFEVVVDAIIASVESAPTEMEFAVIGTSSPANHWKQISSFAHDNAHLVNTLAAQSTFVSYEYMASTYAYALAEYFSLEDTTAEGWDRTPFKESCSSIDVIIIGDSGGSSDDNDPFSTPSPGSQNYLGVDNPVFGTDYFETVQAEDEEDTTLLDDVAFYAANNDLSGLYDGDQTVRTHTILVDADTVNDIGVEKLFSRTAEAGAGIYVRTSRTTDVAVGISMAMTDAIRSMTGITTANTTATGHRLFRSYTETWGFDDDGYRGVPLYRGHFQAFNLCNNPSGCDLDGDGDVDYDFGEQIDGPESDGALWDAGQILASRVAVEGGANSEEFQPDPALRHTYERTLWTNPAQEDPALGLVFTPREMEAFDSTNIDDLGELMLAGWDPSNLNGYAVGDPECETLKYDLNGDCLVNTTDIQLVVDFLRGVPDATYGVDFPTAAPDVGDPGYDVITSPPLSLRRGRGPWKMGGMFLSQMTFADSTPPIVTDDGAFYQFLLRIASLDAVAYIPDNNGFLHSFKVPFLDSDQDGWEDLVTDGHGGFELWGYIPRHLLQHDSSYHQDLHRAINLKLDGELYLHDGSVNLQYVWMDGIPNNVDSDCTEADEDGAKDADGCDYHRILVVSMGLGSNYHYAIDVSHPWHPKFLWEWHGDSQGWRKGLSVGEPVIGEVYDSDNEEFIPVVFWTAGTKDNDGQTHNSRQIAAKWYMHDLLYPRNWTTFSRRGYDIPGSFSAYTSNGARYSTSDPAAGVFGTPAAVDYDEDGTTDALYMGTRHGYVYKVLIDNGELSESTMEDTDSVCQFHAPATTPPANAYANGDFNPSLHNADSDAVYFRPSVARDSSGRVHVSWGTGWPGNLFEAYDYGHAFFVMDGESAGEEWACEAAVESECGPSFDPMTLESGEKLVGPVLTYGGMVLFATYVTDNDVDGRSCGVGHARIYALSMNDCTGVDEWADLPDGVEADASGRYVQTEGIPSRFAYNNDGAYITITGADGAISTIGPLRPQATTASGDRIFYANWRNVY